MKQTSQRTILFRRNINRTNEEWAHFLEGYREWLMQYDINEFGDDWHTAEDIVSEIYLLIITEPLVTNLHPKDSFRHTLITLCRHKHNSFTKPWRKRLVAKLCDALCLNRPSAADHAVNMALGYYDLQVENLMDDAADGARPYTTFSLKDLRNWREMRKAGEDERSKDVARRLEISESALSKSVKKVEDHLIETTREIMIRWGIRERQLQDGSL